MHVTHLIRRLSPWLLAAGCWLVASRSPAQDGVRTEVELKAHRHFQRALKLSDAGEYAEALVELERAYQTAPHYAVLYNIGLVWMALEQPDEAIAALEQYLKDGGEAIPDARRREVGTLLHELRAHLATLHVELVPPEASVQVDGESVALGEGPLTVGAGIHRMVATHDGRRPASVRVAIRGGETRTVRLELEPLSPQDARQVPTPVPPVLGFARVRCAVPDVAITVDDRAVASTPHEAPIVLPAGDHRFGFRRAGYAERGQTIAVRADAGIIVDCAVTPQHVLPASLQGRLVVEGAHQARVLVDGAALPASLPVGRHTLSVERAGYERWSQDVVVRPGVTSTVAVVLDPTSDTRDVWRRDRRRRHIGSAAFFAGSVAVGWAAADRLRAARDRHASYVDVQTNELDPLLFEGLGSRELAEHQRENDRRLQRAHDLEMLGVGFAVASGALAVTGATLLLWPNPHGRAGGVAISGSSITYGRDF